METAQYNVIIDTNWENKIERLIVYDAVAVPSSAIFFKRKEENVKTYNELKCRECGDIFALFPVPTSTELENKICTNCWTAGEIVKIKKNPGRRHPGQKKGN